MALEKAHDDRTGDHLLRLWEGADDWVQASVENTINRGCDGLSTEARFSLQQRLKALQNGGPEEILIVLAGLSRDSPGWASAREGDVLAAALKTHPELAKAAAEAGILRAGNRDWRAFAWFLERRFPEEYGRNRIPAEDPNRPKIINARFSLWAPNASPNREESPDGGAGLSNKAPP